MESSLVSSREEPKPNCKDDDVRQEAVEQGCDEQGTPRRQDLAALPSEGIVIKADYIQGDPSRR